MIRIHYRPTITGLANKHLALHNKLCVLANDLVRLLALERPGLTVGPHDGQGEDDLFLLVGALDRKDDPAVFGFGFTESRRRKRRQESWRLGNVSFRGDDATRFHTVNIPSP